MEKSVVPELSVIVNVYKQAFFFDLCLESLCKQKFKNFEIIVADDGSGPEIGQVVKKYKDKIRLKHIWQEDRGFRKAKILNKAVAIAQAHRLFFIDGDILLHPSGTGTVMKYLKKNAYMTTRVVRLSRRLRSMILDRKIRSGEIFSTNFFMTVMADWIIGKTRFFEYSFLLPESAACFFQRLKKSKHVFGGCWAVMKSDFKKVNGYDNSYVGYGHEDFDISWRLHWAGVKPGIFTNQLIMYHLYHRKRRENLDNKSKKMETKKLRRTECSDGIDHIKMEDIIIK